MPPHQVAQDLTRSPYSNLDAGLASWPLEVGQSGLDVLLQRSNEGFDLLTRCHDRNPPPRSNTQRTLASVGGAQTETAGRSEEHTSELQSRSDLVCRLLLEKKNHGCLDAPRPPSLHTPAI